MALEHNRKLKMKKILIPLLAILLIAGLASCSSNDKKQSDDEKIESIFNTDSSNSLDSSGSSDNSPNTRSETDDSQYPPGFSAQARKDFYALATTGPIDLANPELYLSPRWNMIIGYDRPVGVVPITELNNSNNSDLDLTTFNALRKEAIAVSKASITGLGTEAYPTYFDGNTEVRNCSNYLAQNAGVTSLPITQNKTWAIAIVISVAKCENTEELHATSRQQFDQTFFFRYSNGNWTAITENQLP